MRFLDRVSFTARRLVHRIARKLRKVALDPELLGKKAGVVFGVDGSRSGEAVQGGGLPGAGSHALPRLRLEPGERVRVKSEAAIMSTLDEAGRYQGLGYMPSTMSEYCGGTYVVRKRVSYFFDERTRKMLKLRDVVVLDDVLCEPPAGDPNDFAGCDRSCFLFWKEAWLERVE